MLPHSTKLTRAESARINGAKSRGPKTPAGLSRSPTASLRHGLYAVRSYMLPGESTREYAEFHIQLLAAKVGYEHHHIAVVAQNVSPNFPPLPPNARK